MYDCSDIDDKNTLRINVRRGKVWNDTFELLEATISQILIYQGMLRITGEEAVDLGDPRREFFSVLFRDLEQQRIVASSRPCLTFSRDILAYEGKEYEICGVLVVLSLLNGCSGRHNLSPSLVQYILHEEKQFCKFKIGEIPNSVTRSKCQELETLEKKIAGENK